MNSKNTDFPQYRVLSNRKSWFKILNKQNFVEVQLMGKKYKSHTVFAQQYPEMLRIQDMLTLAFEYYEMSTEEEFDFVFSQTDK